MRPEDMVAANDNGGRQACERLSPVSRSTLRLGLAVEDMPANR